MAVPGTRGSELWSNGLVSRDFKSGASNVLLLNGKRSTSSSSKRSSKHPGELGSHKRIHLPSESLEVGIERGGASRG